jgi:hypothetical protein
MGLERSSRPVIVTNTDIHFLKTARNLAARGENCCETSFFDQPKDRESSRTRGLARTKQWEEPRAPGDGAGDGARAASRDNDRLQAAGKRLLAYHFFDLKMRMPCHAKPPTLCCRAFERQ